jgi:hypothetical protein
MISLGTGSSSRRTQGLLCGTPQFQRLQSTHVNYRLVCPGLQPDQPFGCVSVCHHRQLVTVHLPSRAQRGGEWSENSLPEWLRSIRGLRIGEPLCPPLRTRANARSPMRLSVPAREPAFIDSP